MIFTLVNTQVGTMNDLRTTFSHIIDTLTDSDALTILGVVSAFKKTEKDYRNVLSAHEQGDEGLHRARHQ